jgi:hypothetical protein
MVPWNSLTITSVGSLTLAKIPDLEARVEATATYQRAWPLIPIGRGAVDGLEARF